MAVDERVRGVLELTRPVNALVAGILTFTGAFIAQGGELVGSAESVTIAALVTVLATGAGNAINDYFDREVDQITNPERPLPRGAVTPRTALLFSAMLFILAGGLSLTLPPIAIAIALINIGLLVIYTPLLKGLPGVGNAAIAYLGGSAFLFGGAAVESLTAPGILFAIATLATFSREVIKDVEDLAGDQENDLKTLPIVIGTHRALVGAAVVLCLMALLIPLPYLYGTLGRLYLVLVVPATLAMLYAGWISFTDPTRGQSVLKYGTFLTAAAFIGGRLATII
jgi:geranylgeranylglycerol-phosphate geranylgeranyltransferase